MDKRVTIGQKDSEPIVTTVSEDAARVYEDMSRDPHSPHILWVRVEDANPRMTSPLTAPERRMDE